MRSTRDKADYRQTHPVLEAMQFDLAEAAALIDRLREHVATLEGKRIPPPVPPLRVFEAPVKKQRPLNPNAYWVSVREASQLAGVHTNTIWRWFKKGLPYTRPGGNGNVRIRQEALKKYMESQGRR